MPCRKGWVNKILGCQLDSGIAGAKRWRQTTLYKEVEEVTEDQSETLLMRSSHYEIISFWTISQMVLSDIFACIVCTHVCRHSLSKHMQRNSTDGSMSFPEYYWSCWFIIWRSPQSPQTGVLCITAIWKFAHLTKHSQSSYSHLRSVQGYSCFNCLFIKRLQVQGNLWDSSPSSHQT